MTDFIKMLKYDDGTNFLRKHMFKSTLSSDGTKMEIEWNCWPQAVPYSYSYFGKTYSGYYSGGTPSKPGGIYRKEDNYERHVRQGIFEGVRTHSIQWRKNGGSWSTIKPETYEDHIKKQTSTKNGDVYEIKVTYYLCTMGFPHRWYPFMWFGNYGLKGLVYYHYANGKYKKFTDASPYFPGTYYPCVPDAWNPKSPVSYTWEEPRTKKCWSKEHGKDNPKTAPWISSGHYQKNATSAKTEQWTSEKGNVPQASRCSSYFIYKREFTDTFTTSGIQERPAEAKPPEMPIVKPVAAHGEYGNVRVTYNHSSGMDGFIDLYGIQKNGKAVCVATNVEALNGDTQQIYVDFRKFNFIRSQDVRYYAIAKCYDEEYKTYRTTASIKDLTESTLYSNSATGHYFNDEPPAVNPRFLESDDTTEVATVVFDHVLDPDKNNTGDTVSYIAYIKSANEELNTNTKTFSGPGVSGEISYCMSTSPTINNKIDIDTTIFKDRERIKVWIESTDGYENSYYNTSQEIEVIKTKSPNAIIDVINSHGESGKIRIKYTHEKNVPGFIRVMAFQSDDNTGLNGKFIKNIRNKETNNSEIPFTINEIDTWKELNINFSDYFVRSRYISYFVIAVDNDGKMSYTKVPTWYDCTAGHYFNEEPPPVTPIVDIEALKTDIAYLSWPESIDPDGDETTYELFISSNNGESGNEQEHFTGPGVNGNLWYDKKIVTKKNYYNFDITQYDNSKLSAWIRTKDGYENSYYYTGNMLKFENEGAAPYKTLVTPVFAHEEYGDLYINYTHPTNRPGRVYLYAICKYKDTTKETRLVNVFRQIDNKDYVELSSGSNQPYVIDFRKLLGNTPYDRSCEIRYYAVSYTIGFEENPDDVCSEGPGWTPSVDMYSKWATGHYYNEEPSAVEITIDEDKTDKHENIYLTWNDVEDPDNDITKYYVYLNAISNPFKKSDKFFLGNIEDRYLNYTHEYVTENNNLNISLRDFDEDEEFELWIQSTDGYPNSYYYCSDMITFQKLSYHAPKVFANIDNIHGERGTITVRYSHPDLGQEDRTDFDGTVSIYAYVNNEFSKTIIEDEPFRNEETKTFNIEFSDISNRRSTYISYFVVAKDNLKGMLSSDTNVFFASGEERIGSNEEGNIHYFNEEPSIVFLNTGQPDRDEDRPIYMFDYINIIWNEATEPDGDDIIYNIYLKSINSEEPTYSKSFDFSYGKEVKQYNRHYKVTYNKDKGLYETYKFLPDSNKYVLEDKDNKKLLFKINYTDIDESWPEPDEWKNKNGEIWIETSDGYENSYYNTSSIYEFTRQKHEPPNAVKIQCVTAHEERGDLSISYTHPENIEGTIYLYGYENGKYVGLIDTLTMKSGTSITKTIEFESLFNRSTNISYYAIAKDNLLGLGLLSDNRNPEDITIDEHATGHYFNDEPEAPNISLVEGHTPFDTVKVKWDLVEDPDGDDVNYYIYLRCSTLSLNTKEEEFFGNKNLYEYGDDESDNPVSNGYITYHSVYKITPQMIANNNYHEGFDINITQFSEDERLEIWIQTRDDYPNSYYYSGNILVFDKGHTANKINQAYPRTNTVVYSKTPRILVELANDNLPQEVFVKWGNTTYSNKTHSEYFSSRPEDFSRAVIFRPPTAYTTKHNSKVPYSVKINNTCTTTDETYYTYIYKNFMEDFSDTKFIPLKSNHINTFKEAVNDVRDAYGLETVLYNRKIQRDMIFDNEDYNSVDAAIKDVNEKINNADITDRLDDNRTYIEIEDGTLIGYDSETDTDFTEWQQLLDLLENM